MLMPGRLAPLVLLAVVGSALSAMPAGRSTPGRGRVATRFRAAPAYARLPAGFEVNRGQVDGRIKFLSHAAGYTLALMDGGVVLEGNPAGRAPSGGHGGVPSAAPRRVGDRVDSMLLRFDGANPRARIVGLQRLPGTVNYFIGDDPRRWRTDISTYARVEYRDLYPGVSLVYSGTAFGIEGRWLLAPHARAGRIGVTVAGGRLRVTGGGALVISGAAGRFTIAAPRAYQSAGGKRRSIAVRYVIRGARRFGLHLGAYDARSLLIVDPVLGYATYLGGSSPDYTSGIAVDRHGSAYAVGSTLSPDFPVVRAAQSVKPSTGDHVTAFVTRFNPAGTALLYSTYLGGTRDESGTDIAVDRTGAAYVTGFTNSTDFPRKHPLRSAARGCNRDPAHAGDAFVAKLSPAGDRLIYSTCLGGSGADWGSGIAVDAVGAVYVTGATSSTDFPVKQPLQRRRAGQANAFVARISRNGGSLTYSTYLGGSGADQGSAIAVDATGSASIVGATTSWDFPLRSPMQRTFGGGDADAFVARLEPGGRALRYSTYLGGSGADQAAGVAVDGAGDVYVAGATQSANFPTANALQPRYGGVEDAFVTAFDPTGTRMLYSTYLGGGSSDAAMGIAIDTRADVFLTGSTRSPDFPTRNPLQAIYGGGYYYGDAFAAEIAAGGAALAYSTYLGGAGDDVGMGIAVDGQGSAYITGGTSSLNFPVRGGLPGGRPARGDAFVVKIARG